MASFNEAEALKPRIRVGIDVVKIIRRVDASMRPRH